MRGRCHDVYGVFFFDMVEDRKLPGLHMDWNLFFLVSRSAGEQIIHDSDRRMAAEGYFALRRVKAEVELSVGFADESDFIDKAFQL